MRVLFLSCAVLAAGLVVAQPHQHGTPTPPSAPPASAAPHAHATGAVDFKHLGELAALSGPAFDRAYLSMMIGHHEVAVEMSRLALPKVRDARLRGWIDQVLLGQESEIREMTAYLRDAGLTVDEQARTAMRRDMQAMVDAVRAAAQPEEAWVTHMIDHHALGLMMATLGLSRGDREAVRLSARGVARVQADQMYEYRGWISDR